MLLVHTTKVYTLNVRKDAVEVSEVLQKLRVVADSRKYAVSVSHCHAYRL